MAMQVAIWLVLAGVGSTLVILGGFMTLGSLLLWLNPAAARRPQDPSALQPSTAKVIQLLAVALSLTLLGLTLLLLRSFPNARYPDAGLLHPPEESMQGHAEALQRHTETVPVHAKAVRQDLGNLLALGDPLGQAVGGKIC
ncbi:hypothetical protein DO97_20875 [Neosynechococcus sphagnicola sy1]|uniref:Uncharacterized protein n=2 Tax=Neosynechococcus TaxID=1501143 RepID=A0A098TLV2_9CYAN|nr:hypothetical protein DO97_20875 [Neosynechococcus sphagnicola sy1]